MRARPSLFQLVLEALSFHAHFLCNLKIRTWISFWDMTGLLFIAHPPGLLIATPMGLMCMPVETRTVHALHVCYLGPNLKGGLC